MAKVKVSGSGHPEKAFRIGFVSAFIRGVQNGDEVRIILWVKIPKRYTDQRTSPNSCSQSGSVSTNSRFKRASGSNQFPRSEEDSHPRNAAKADALVWNIRNIPHCHLTLNSSLSTLIDFAWSAASGQGSSDSEKTYGPDDTDLVRHQWYGNPGTVLLNRRFWLSECTYGLPETWS
jgi:hypothetical protein